MEVCTKAILSIIKDMDRVNTQIKRENHTMESGKMILKTVKEHTFGKINLLLLESGKKEKSRKGIL